MSTGSRLLRGSLLLGCALILTSASAEARPRLDLAAANEMPSVFTSTIGHVIRQRDKSATVYADKEARVLTIPAALQEKIALAMDAHRRRCTVRFSLRTPTPNSRGGALVNDVELVSCGGRGARSGRPDLAGWSEMIRSGDLPIDYTSYMTYQPVRVRNVQEAQGYFRLSYPYRADDYDVNDNCFNRAHFWARSIQVNELFARLNRGTDKVFIFFTDAYQKAFKHKWWFHVAPVIYVIDAPYVVDPTFLTGAVSLEEWLASFDGHLGGQCQEIRTIDEYYARSNEVACFYAVSNMFTYTPRDLDGVGPSNWRCSDIENMMRSLPPPGAGTGRERGGWEGETNIWIRPQHCGGRAIPGT